VTSLRQRVLDERQRRNYSPATTRGYILAIKQFADYFGKSPERLGGDEVRQLETYLLRDKKLSVDLCHNLKCGIITQKLYCLLAQRYVENFDQKWTVDNPAATEGLLGAADIQSLADLGNSYSLVGEMRTVPSGCRTSPGSPLPRQRLWCLSC